MGKVAVGESRRPFWRDVIGRWRHSGQSVAEFCRREAVAVSTFYLWRRRLEGQARGERAAARFVPVQVTDRTAAGPAVGSDDPRPLPGDQSAHGESTAAVPQASTTPVDLILGARGLRVQLHRDFDRAALAQLLKMLGHGGEAS